MYILRVANPFIELFKLYHFTVVLINLFEAVIRELTDILPVRARDANQLAQSINGVL